MKRDRIAFVGLMVARLGFVIALLLGLAMLANLVVGGALVFVHMVSGLLILFGTWLTALRFAALRKGSMTPLWTGAVLAAVGALQALGMVTFGPQVTHAVVMLAAIGLAEMGAARVNRAG